jgi:O-antigen/teichoic acid export membrane protein
MTTDLVSVALLSTDTLLLGYFGSTRDIAALRAVAPIARLNQFIISAFAVMFTPMAARLFARGDGRGLDRYYWQTTSWIAVATLPFFVLTFAFAGPVTTSLFSARYAGSAALLAVLSLGYYVQSATGYNGMLLAVTRRVGYITKINVAAVVVNMATGLLLIPIWGAMGAAVSISLSFLAHNVMKQIGLRRGTGVRMLPAPFVMLLVGLLATAAGLLVMQLVLHPPLWFDLFALLLVSIAILGCSRRLLSLGEVFPEVARVPAVGRWLARQ